MRTPRRAWRSRLTRVRPNTLPAKRIATGLYTRSKNGARPRSYAKKVRIRDREVARYIRDLKTNAPWIQPQDEWLLRRYVQLEMLSDRVYFALRESEIINGEGESKRLLTDWRRLVLAQASLGAMLGLNPVARRAARDGASSDAIDIT